MEKQYENEGCDKLMEKYNFDSPIQVTLVIEEEDPQEPVLTGHIVSNTTKVSNSNDYPNSSKNFKRTDSNNSKSLVEEINHSNSVFKTILPEGHQKDTQDIEWQLLDAVADNLIHITKCYYHNFINNKKQMENNEKLKLEYLTFKHNFFNLSYSTTITILLPRENDIYFLNIFIHRIIKIANRNSWFKITYKILEILIHEMFIWTKQKKTNLDIKFGSHIHKKGGVNCSSCTIMKRNRLINQSRQNLYGSSANGPVKNQASAGSNSQPDIVSKTHPPVKIVNISPNIRHITNYSTQELNGPVISAKNISTKTIYPMVDNDNSASSFYIKNNAEPKRAIQWHTNFSENFNSQPEIIISPRIIQKTNHEASSPITDGRINNSRQEINSSFVASSINHSITRITSNYNIEPKTNNFSSCQAGNTNSSKVLLSSGPPNQEITISIDPQILANINLQNTNQLNNNATESHVNEAYETKSIKRRKTNDSSFYPYSNSNTLLYHNDNNFHANQNNSSATNLVSPVANTYYDDTRRAGYQSSNTDTLRSSISRDSGCDSPIYGNFHNEQTIEISNNEEQVIPIISHVSSMKPNNVRVNVGFCKVCGATTSNMCIGCYQDYYCSFSCQAQDWENHKTVCGICR